MNETRAARQAAASNGTTEAFQEQAGKTSPEPASSLGPGEARQVEREEEEEKDSYEAQANELSSVLAEPASANDTATLAGSREDAEGDAEGDEGEGVGEGDHGAEGGPESSLERRIFSGARAEPKAAHLAGEMRRFRHHQRHKLLGKRRRKKRPSGPDNGAGGKPKGKRANLVKSTLTRQSSNAVATSTVGYGHPEAWLPAANQPVPAPNPVGGSLRQHLPLQLSTTVQRLLLDKFAGGGGGGGGGGSSAPAMSLKQQLAAIEQQQASRNSIFFQHPSAFGPEQSGGGEPLLSQWLAHAGDNSFASASSPARAAASAAAKQAAAKMIPIEIIGLDPLVTRQILQSEATGAEPARANLFSASAEPHLSSAAATSSSATRQVPSIVHVHHFHTQQPELAAPAQPPAQPAALPSSSEVSQSQQQEDQSSWQHQVAQQQQQLYWNDKGQLVYLSSAGPAPEEPGGGEFNGPTGAQPSGAGNPRHPQQASGEQQEPAASSGGEPAPEQQQAQEGAETGQRLLQPAPNPQAPDGGGVNLLPNEQFGNTMSNSQVSNLATNGQQLAAAAAAAANRHPQPVFMTTNGQTFSVLSQQDRARQQQQQREAAANGKLLMVAYKPQVQSQPLPLAPGQSQSQSQSQSQYQQLAPPPPALRNSSLQEELMLKGAYNEGQESKATMVSAGGLVLRPLSSILAQFPQQQVPQEHLMEQVGLSLARLQQANASNVAPARPTPPAALATALNRVPSSPAAHDGGRLRPQPVLDSHAGPSFLAANGTAAEEPKLATLKVVQPLAAFNNKLGTSATLGVARLNSSTYNEAILKRLLQELRLKNQHQQQHVGGNFSGGSSPLDQLATATSGQRYLAPGLVSAGPMVPHRKDLKSSNLNPSAPPGAKLRPQIQPDDPPPSTSPALADSSGNIALAFIFLVSLLTVTLIAASMIYRHKRRSVARCSSLPARSRLNLTQRTKRFMRSNFVRPGHHEIITPIRTINLDAGSPSAGAKGDTLSSASLGRNNNEQPAKRTANNGRPPANVTCRAAADRYAAGKQHHHQHQPAGPLSTFASLSQFGGGGGGGGGGGCEDATADIKTLNTRLQKSTYLKSLISAPSTGDCSAAAAACGKQPGKQGQQELSRQGRDAFCYLNVRHKSPAKQPIGGGQKSLARGSSGDAGECRRSQSFKKLSSDLHTYNFAFKASPIEPDGLSVDSKHLGRMSTIHSVGDSKYNVREPTTRTSANISYRASELNNLMGQKHLARRQLLQHHHSLHHNQTDRL